MEGCFPSSYLRDSFSGLHVGSENHRAENEVQLIAWGIKREEARGELVAKTIPEFSEERSLRLVCRQTIMLPPACAPLLSK